jgi:hypothetical protein
MDGRCDRKPCTPAADVTCDPCPFDLLVLINELFNQIWFLWGDDVADKLHAQHPVAQPKAPFRQL